MRFSCQLQQRFTGDWVVRYRGTDLGAVDVTADSRDAALQKMRGELRYLLEYCPCTGELYRDVEIEIVEE